MRKASTQILSELVSEANKATHHILIGLPTKRSPQKPMHAHVQTPLSGPKHDPLDLEKVKRKTKLSHDTYPRALWKQEWSQNVNSPISGYWPVWTMIQCAGPRISPPRSRNSCQRNVKRPNTATADVTLKHCKPNSAASMVNHASIYVKLLLGHKEAKCAVRPAL